MVYPECPLSEPEWTDSGLGGSCGLLLLKLAGVSDKVCYCHPVATARILGGGVEELLWKMGA